MSDDPEHLHAAAISELDLIANARLIFGFEAAAMLAQELGVALPPDDEPIDPEQGRSAASARRTSGSHAQSAIT